MLGIVTAASAHGAARTGQHPAINDCALLTVQQAATFMGAAPVGGGSLDRNGCSWQTDLNSSGTPTFVTVHVEALKMLLGKRYRNIRTYLEKSTTVGIDPLPGVGSEAFSTYTVLIGPGHSDGFLVRKGSQVLEIGFQRPTPLKNPSPEFDQVVDVVKAVVATLRGH